MVVGHVGPMSAPVNDVSQKGCSKDAQAIYTPRPAAAADRAQYPLQGTTARPSGAGACLGHLGQGNPAVEYTRTYDVGASSQQEVAAAALASAVRVRAHETLGPVCWSHCAVWSVYQLVLGPDGRTYPSNFDIRADGRPGSDGLTMHMRVLARMRRLPGGWRAEF